MGSGPSENHFRRGRRDGWTYFIQAVAGGPVKIGTTLKNPQTRLTSLQCGNPEELRIVCLLPGIYLEEELHEAYAVAHIRGEWFEPIVLEWAEEDFPLLRAIRGEGVLKSL